MDFSTYQLNIFNKITTNLRSSFIINAVPGSGKTTTIIESIIRLKKERRTRNILALSFNNSISKELELRLPKFTATCKTTSAIGLELLNKYFGIVLKVNNNKYRDNLKLEEWSNIITPKQGLEIINLARLKGFYIGKQEPDLVDITEILLELDITTLEEENLVVLKKFLDNNLKTNLVTEIDFIDMIYLPCKIGINDLRFSDIFIDEYQDLSNLQIQFLKLFKNSRYIFAGDNYQAIYQFSGASSESYNIIKGEFKCEILPLNISYRCPIKITSLLKTFNKDIESNKDGGFITENKSLKEIPLESGEEFFIIARKNYQLIPIIPTILDKINEYPIINKTLEQTILNSLNKCKSYTQKQVETLFNALNSKLDDLNLKLKLELNMNLKRILILEILKIEKDIEELNISRSIKSLNNYQNFLEDIKSNKNKNNKITLMSAHKSKGLESKNIIILKDKEWWENTSEQESNLRYVSISRTLENLYIIDI